MKNSFDRATLLKTLLGFGHQKAIWRAALLVLCAFCVMGIFADLLNTVKFGQFDFRNRVVGARAMLLDKDPYTYRWHPGEPTTLLDPFIGPNGSISGVTVTPAVLAVQVPLANLHYRTQKLIWALTQFALFAGIVWLACRRADTLETKAAILLAGVMFSCTVMWHIHVERGQAYVLFGFFAVLYISSFVWRSTYRGLLSGIILGLLVCLRPHMAMLGLPLLIYRKWISVVGSVVGIALGLLGPQMISQTVWVDYVHAMTRYVEVRPPSDDARPVPPPQTFEYPKEIEGMENLGTYANFGDHDSSLKGTLTYLRIPTSPNLFLGLLVVGTVAWLISIFRMNRQGVPLDFCTVKTLGLVLFIELMLPIKRAEYSNLILMTIVLPLFAIRSQIFTIRTWEWCLLLGAWFFSAPFPPWLSAGYRMPPLEAISAYLILLWIWLAPWKEKSLPTEPVPSTVGALAARS